MIERRKLTVADFLLMGEAGVFAPDERVELLDGETYTVSLLSSRRAAWVGRVMKALERTCGKRPIVRVQSPVKLSETSSPKPDVAVLNPQADLYETTLPGSQDVLLVVEVSLATLTLDRTTKLTAYAPVYRNTGSSISKSTSSRVYREPQGGRYRAHLLLELTEAVVPVAVSDASAVVF